MNNKKDYFNLIETLSKEQIKVYNFLKNKPDLLDIYLNEIKVQRDLEELSLLDPLTKLGNKRKFDRDLKIIKEISDRNKENFSLVYIDLDSFKEINDLYGHPVGDKVLMDVGLTLENSIRKYDLAYRQGGDEFALILPNTGLSYGRIIAERVRKNITQIIYGDKKINASLGIGNYKLTSLNLEDLINYTDKALLHAKYKLGKNLVGYHDGESLLPLKKAI